MKNNNPVFKLILMLVCILCYTATLFAQECGVIYVTPTGSPSGTAGTKANPASFAYGLTLVSGTANKVWLATGTYPLSTTLSIPSNVTIEGGFNSTNWLKSNVAQSILDKDATNALPSPFRALVALGGNAVSNFRLQDLTINVANAGGNQISVYGIYLAACSNYFITRCTVNTGSGSPGLAGAPGTAGNVGPAGAAGLPAGDENNIPAGGAGGVGSGGTVGGAGGSGAKHVPNGTETGTNGSPACGGAGGTGGDGPNCGCGFGGSTNTDCSGSSPTAGQPGGIGTIGTTGTTGASGIVFSGYWVPGGAGGPGGTGTSGCGGGGGGGGAGRQQPGPDQVGGSGGGGGAGGTGGTGGQGGTGGGSSYAIFLYTNGAGGVIKDCFLNPGPGGMGGAGGAGGAGGPGGAGGIGGAGFGCGISVGADGGAGGAGGQGGSGGAGANGVSVALSENGGVPVTSVGITAVPGNPPVINTVNKGCTNSEVLISSPTSGTWNFGAGATPSTATGTGPFSVFYSSLGRKTITLNGTVFTDYVDIFQAGPSSSGSILPSNGSVTLGCPNTFTTVLTGTYYEWYFGPAAAPDSMEGTAMQTVNGIYFAAPGTYTIYVYVTTACCGRLLDSTTVTVTPSNFDITLTATPTSACIGDPITFNASPTNYLVYVFTVNDSVVQNGAGTTYTSSTLSLGDSVVVTALQGTCFTNPSATVLAIVLPPPTVTLISSDPDSSICEGENILFIATPLGYTNYEFFDGATSIQSGASITYTTSTLPIGNSITVVASNMGCTGPPSNPSVTTVNLNPDIVLTSSDPDNVLCGGGGDSVEFTASPAGFTNYNFIENGISTQNGASNTYIVAVTSTSTLEVITTSQSGCVDSTSNVITTSVNPIPTVTLESSDLDNTICENELIIFTATPTGYDNYEFFNNGISIQNGATNNYSTTLNPGNSITVIATDLGCASLESTPIVVTVMAADSVNAGSDFSACINATPITLTPITPANGTWTGPGITGPGVFTPSTAGTGIHNLTYSYTNSSGCTAMDTALATVNALPVITLTPSSPFVCDGIPTSITASGATTYNWSPATGLSTTSGAAVMATPTSNTTYTITGTSNNCSDSITVSIPVYTVPDVTISGLNSINVCEDAVLTAEVEPVSNGTYSWTPPVNLTCATCASATVAPTSTQTYTVTYTSPQGCSDSASVTITIVSIFNYFMPNAFTPNGDGINDTLHVHGKGIESISLKLFDRIGEKVFETTTILEGWDGTHNGTPVNNGTYVYVLEVVYCNGERKTEHGNVTLAK